MCVTREIYVRRLGGEMQAAVMEDGHLVEYLPDDGSSAADAVLLGRVERVVPGMKAAFVQIGQERNGFLPLEEHGCDLPKLQTGQTVMVQVRKEAHGEKGAFLSRNVTLCGETVLVCPLGSAVAVSSRITQEGSRKALKAMGKRIADGAYGLVMRAAALTASEDEVRSEAESLMNAWQEIARRAPTAHVPSVLHTPRTILDELLDDYRPRGIHRIVTNDAALADRLGSVAPVTLASDTLFETARITNQLKRGLERRVWLDNGGNLVFDPCEAMTVVDVNTAKYTGDSDLRETVLRMNLEACAEVARQVRLRGVSGIIIIDMIDMVGSEQHQAVLDELTRCFAQDRIKTVIHGFTSLGLVEMTRRRTRKSLRDMLKREPD